MSAVAST